MSISKSILRGLGVLGLLTLVGCATVPIPVERTASAKAAIRSAAEVGPSENQEAVLHLQMARDEFARAEQLVKQEENERAAGQLMRAEADANLALALGRQAAAESDAAAIEHRVNEMASAQ